MKKKIAIILLCVLFFLVLGGKTIYELWESSVFIFERTATVYVEGLEWDGSPKTFTVDCYVIPEEHHAILEKHFR